MGNLNINGLSGFENNVKNAAISAYEAKKKGGIKNDQLSSISFGQIKIEGETYQVRVEIKAKEGFFNKLFGKTEEKVETIKIDKRQVKQSSSEKQPEGIQNEEFRGAQSANPQRKRRKKVPAEEQKNELQIDTPTIEKNRNEGKNAEIKEKIEDLFDKIDKNYDNSNEIEKKVNIQMKIIKEEIKKLHTDKNGVLNNNYYQEVSEKKNELRKNEENRMIEDKEKLKKELEDIRDNPTQDKDVRLFAHVAIFMNQLNSLKQENKILRNEKIYGKTQEILKELRQIENNTDTPQYITNFINDQIVMGAS